MKTLYKKDNNGKIRVWAVDVIGSTVVVEHGVLNGKLITETYTVEPKNYGRSNETIAEEQAIKEMKSMGIRNSQKLKRYSINH